MDDVGVESTGRDSAGRRRPWITSGVVVAISGVVALLAASFHLGLPWWMRDGDRDHVYRSSAGIQHYQVHLPPQHGRTARLPVIMAIHGCGMTGFGWNSMKAATQFSALADAKGFIVVYPTQRVFRSAINCWNPSDPREQHRGTGEPALLAGVAREVVREYHADPLRVHVAGASSGAGTAVILAATYPDVFATVTSVAGGEYGLNQVDTADPDSTPPAYTGRQAWSQMGDRARSVPLLVIQGEDDDVVPPIVGRRLAQQWRAIDDLVDDGMVNDSRDLSEEVRTFPALSGRHGYTHTVFAAPGAASVVEMYRVRGMGHVWPGPTAHGLFTDRAGPDASALVWDFARRHPMVPSPVPTSIPHHHR